MNSKFRRYGMLAVLLISALFVSWALPRFLVRSGTGVRAVADRGSRPQIQFPDLNGNMWQLSGQRGRVVLVNFWATWCPPCRHEIPMLMRLASRRRGVDFEMVGVAVDQYGEQKVRSFSREAGINYPVLLGPDAGVNTLPTSYLIDREGRVAKTYVGELDERVEEDINALVAEPLPAVR